VTDKFERSGPVGRRLASLARRKPADDQFGEQDEEGGHYALVLDAGIPEAPHAIVREDAREVEYEAHGDRGAAEERWREVRGDHPSQRTVADLAAAAARRGESWGQWSSGDEAYDAIQAAGRIDSGPVEAAHRAARREGFRTAWTTAPEAYDVGETSTVELAGDYDGKPLRKVAIAPRDYEYQRGRNASGLHGLWDEDPREERARWAREREAERAAEVERARVREAGLAWLRDVPDSSLDDLDDNLEERQRRGLRYEDVRDERKGRREAREAEERAARWAAAAAVVPVGATILDRRPRTRYGGGPHVWHSVQIEPHYARRDDPDEAGVVGEGRDRVGSLSDVADAIRNGHLEVTEDPTRIPPRAVVERVGQNEWQDISPVTVGGEVVWVARQPFAREPLVMDARGHLVRSARVRDAALGREAPTDRSVTYRGWTIEPYDGTQVGYSVPRQDGIGTRPGRGRNVTGYLLSGPDGAKKIVDTKKAAKEYIDAYEGEETP
jgi:hypothetical protein